MYLPLALQVADIGERGELLGVLVPAGVEGEDVLLEHPLKQPDHVVAVLQEQPVLRGIPGEGLKVMHPRETQRREAVSRLT
ncbi:hypothetical protein [Sorangium sp. So ce1389]|uniref:hypothetical protein n=1 Tax=Sorangium sp. So ce1389 TaxID=3133336 RepID=UPI003F5ED09C